MDKPIRLSQESKVKLLDYFTRCFDYMSTNEWGMRDRLLERDLEFYRENDWDQAHKRAQLANRRGDSKRLQNVQVPIVMPQVEAQLADLSSIFLTGYPIFGVVSSPETADAATAFEAQISDNAIQFGWPRHLMLSLRDGLKYNLQAVEVDWAERRVGSVLNDLEQLDSTIGAASQTLYAGNRIKRIDLYNAVLDPRVAPANIHTEGEFAGYSELVGRIELKRRLANLPRGTLMDATKAFESGVANITGVGGVNNYYIPQINNQPLVDPMIHKQDWLTWLGLDTGKIKYSPSYEWCVLYARLIPSEVKVPVDSAPNTPRIFKLIVINRRVVVYAQIMTNAHDYLPIIVGQPEEDGLGYQTKSFSEHLEPYQQLSTGLWTAVMEGQRRAVYDRLLYDPDRVRLQDINKADSVGRIAVRGKQYSRNVADGVAALPYRMENQAGVMQLIQSLGMYADETSGSNKASRGQFQKGNRTRFEYEDIMGGTAGRTRTRALALEYQFFVPIKEVIKLNSLQYQAPAEFTDQRTGAQVQVNPADMRKLRLDFKMSDGLLPSSKMLAGDVLEKVTQYAMAVPAIAAEYDVMEMLTYNWKQSGAWWLPSFKRTPEQKAQMMGDMAATNPRNGAGNPSQQPGVSNGPSPAQ